MYVLIGLSSFILYVSIRKFFFKRGFFELPVIQKGMLATVCFWLFVFGLLFFFDVPTINLLVTVDLFSGLCLMSAPVMLLIVESLH